MNVFEKKEDDGGRRLTMFLLWVKAQVIWRVVRRFDLDREQSAAQQFDLVQSVKHFEAVVSLTELLWVVWFDLAARLAVILQEKETRGDSPVSPKTHHLLHFVDFVSCAIRQNCPHRPPPSHPQNCLLVSFLSVFQMREILYKCRIVLL